MSVISRRIWLFSVVAAFSLGTPAEEPPGEIEGELRLYTNADLKRSEPISAPPREPAARPDLDWAFVVQFLDRQHALLEAEKRYRLEREAIDRMAEAAAAASRRRSYLAPFGGVFGFHARPLRHPGALKPHRLPESSVHGAGPPMREFLSRRITLHGRPPAGGHGAASGLSGADAVPDRQRPSGAGPNR